MIQPCKKCGFPKCVLCWDKGYATVRYGFTMSADFEGEKEYVDPIKTHIVYCSCDRGKQLKEQILALLKDLMAELPKEIDCEETTNEIPTEPTLAADQARNYTIREITAILQNKMEEVIK